VTLTANLCAGSLAAFPDPLENLFFPKEQSMPKRVCLTAAILVLLTLTAGNSPLSAQVKASADEAAIKALYTKWNDAFNKKDANTVMSFYAPDVFVYDVIPPRAYPSWDSYKKNWEGLFAQFPGPLTNTVSDLKITVVGPVAYTRFINDGTMTAKDGTRSHVVVRSTDVWRKIDGKWLIVEEHNSVPVDLATGKPDMLSTP
jgi:uncharacterized protein (TIGR02246 family)